VNLAEDAEGAKQSQLLTPGDFVGRSLPTSCGG